MRVILVLLSVSMAGCFHSIGSDSDDPLDPPRPFDGGPLEWDVGSGPDAGPGPDSSPGFDGSMPFDGAVPDAASCVEECEFDSDCPQPPAFGCAQSICVAGRCVVAAAPCGDEEGCDHEELICSPEFVEMTVRLRTDYEAFVDFDRVVLTVDGRVVLQDTELLRDAREGFVFDSVRIGQRENIQIDLTLFRGCEVVASRTVISAPSDGPFEVTFAIGR